ncbi:predicted protein [Scheffersomyces stipitis CBS 6054]|uniref:Uncharacterized protein n=1 Tax=Scheffersomyces stipitis (strain ATCC 58785 / CBS 6054 / NBRC 10063 / NRRL Y-11545) TaxID=322104 RepID=A3LS94_PICST|nr:predicted protein [Scheffersomyces stipitis CBS 6054]ABN65529.2 predicted protein [Scheffersomyces stipitis CBS 6054]
MDNRKVYSSYRDRIRSISVPYRNQNGFLSKVKSLFNSSINEGKPSEDSSLSSEAQTSKIDTPLKRKSESLAVESTTANEILSSFFKEKGDRNLTEVEYEGVMALLSKSRANTPVKRQRLNQDFGNDTENSILNEKSLPPRSAAVDISKVFATPSAQKTLRNVNATMIHDQSSLITDYSPVYHTINESFGNRSISSVKRVYQFSGLPSPYRTRIRAPKSSSLRSSKSKTSSNDVQMNLRKEKSITNKSINTSAIHKPRSAAATTLLSILDGKQTDSEDNVNPTKANIGRFSNPYSSQPSIKKMNKIETVNNTHKNTITANDINKTISYDKSQTLPTTIKLDDTFPKSKTNLTHRTEARVENVQIPNKTNGYPAFKANGTSTNSIPSVLPTVKNAIPKENINFSSKTTKSSIPNFSPEPAESEYEFPELTPIEVGLDAAKVIQYEMLFNF